MSGYGVTAAGTTAGNEDLCFSSSLPPPASRLLIDIDANGTADVNFQYDALGRRVARSGTGGSEVYVQMDQQTIADYPVGGAATTPTFRYVYASYIDEPVVRKTAGTGGTLVYFHRNHQYSVTAVTTSTGAIAERYAYTAYGQPTILDASASVLSSSAINNRYTYTGREWDATLGLHHFRARWMSPSAGRFLTRDPIGYSAGANQYRFIRNRALRYVDPRGWFDIECYPSGTFYIDPDTYDPNTPPRYDWQLRIWLKNQLSSSCSSCNYCNNRGQIPNGCDESSCRNQANDIANAVGNTLENNGCMNPFTRFPCGFNNACMSDGDWPWAWNQRFRGYYCWRWADALRAAMQSAGASCFGSELEFSGYPATSGRIHVWVKITLKCTGQSIYVDDSFGNGSFGNTEPPCGGYPYVGYCPRSALPSVGYCPRVYGPDNNPVH